MNAVDYLKIKGRMTEDCTISCSKCLLDENNNGENIACMNFESEYPEQAVEIVEKWAKENPVKTYLSVLLEKFPNTQITASGNPKFCINTIYNKEFNCDTRCKECWNREYKEGE